MKLVIDLNEEGMDLESFTKMEIADQGKAFVQLKEMIAEAEAVVKTMKSAFDDLRLKAIPGKLEDMGLDNVKIKGVGRISVTTDAYVSVVSGKKEALFDWLKEHDQESLITEVVNSSTLKAWYKEQIKEGNEVPDGEIINFTPFDRASVTKA